MNVCPGCGRCNVCGRPHPAPIYPAPWPNVPYPPPQIPWRNPVPSTTYAPTHQTYPTNLPTTCSVMH